MVGLRKTPPTEKAATISVDLVAEACSEGRQMRIFADANCASAPLVTRSTKIGIWISVFWSVPSISQTASCRTPSPQGY